MPYDAEASLSDEEGGTLGTAGTSTVMCDTSMVNNDCALLKVRKSGSVEAKLEALSVVNDVSVSRSANSKNGYTWTITFNDDGDDFALQGVGLSQPCNGAGLLADTCSLTGTGISG